MAFNPLSFQLYLDSAQAYLQDTTLRNKMGMTLNEPIVVPEGYDLTVSLVDAQIPVNWDAQPLYKYVLVGTNLMSRNQYVKNRYIAKIPKDVPQGFRLMYYNNNDYKHPVSDRKIDYIEVGIYGENGVDLNMNGPYKDVNGGINWSCTLQFDFHKHITKK